MFVPLTVRDFVDRAETVYPDRVGVVDEPDQPAEPLPPLTYRLLADRARAQAARLDQLGIPTGARVAVVSQNSARLLHSFFGVSAYGRVLVPINFRLTADEIDYILKHSGAQAVWVDPSHTHLLDKLSVPHRFVLGEDDDLYRFGVEPRPWATPSEDAPATVNYTSGTTARPKGVQLTHRSLWLNASVLGLHAGVSDRDVYLHTLPLFHVNGWGMPYVVTGLGGQHIILRQVDGTEILRRIERHGVTLLCAAPAVVNAVLDAARDWSGPIPGRDRVRVIVAGAPPSSRTITRVITDLGWEFIQLYGLTETSPLTTFNRMRAEWDGLQVADRARMLGRAGPPALGVRVEVSRSGEVLTSSNHTLAGYLDDPAATSQAQADGRFHTGDVGFLDDDGCLVISDRQKDVIITGGENVSSVEVENVLESHPAVREVAVVGVPDDRWGEMVTALVVLSEGDVITEHELVAHCRRSLAGYKLPKRIEFRAELPRTATGKLQKFKLRNAFRDATTTESPMKASND